tara:strand:- start:6896 stop:8476 length:1581 start_codon:yes stop_codon:yes gene_type:complete
MSRIKFEDPSENAAAENVPLKQGKKRKRRGPRTKENGEDSSTAVQRNNKIIKFDEADETPAENADLAQKLAPYQPDRDTASAVSKLHNHQTSNDIRLKAKNAGQPSDKERKGSYPSSRHNGGVPQHLLKRRDALLPVRKALPIWLQADTIKASLRKNNVLVLTGETGSGKSTQVPQFLASEPWCTKCIAITQPRRVAAISLARRVSEEMGTFMGSQSPTAKVGYSVRFDNATGPGTKLKYLTEGMLLQEMLRDPVMSQYSAIVVDEVHERSVNVDLILGFLKNLLYEIEDGGRGTRKHPLKVVVMSATADVESLVKFFEDSQAPVSTTKPPRIQRQISTCFVEGRQYPVKTVYLTEPTQDWVESALKIIFQIHYKEPLPGDILVFLTGQDTIEGLEKLVNDYVEGMDKEVPKLLTLPLFAALPQHAQQLIFHIAPGRSYSPRTLPKRLSQFREYATSLTAASRRSSNFATALGSNRCSSSPSQSLPLSSAKVVQVVRPRANVIDCTPWTVSRPWTNVLPPRYYDAT